MTFDAIAGEVAAATTADDRRIIISPILRVLSDGADAPYYLFYSVITTGFRVEKIHIVDPIERLEVVGRLFAHQPPLELHFPDDELATLRLCENFWPCERVTALRAEVEAALASMKA
jgi:hypothetical protein